ncbi:MAG: DegT/DnrJ/EryC1/StrS family aminotransferase, partial [Proteobacteria bacterium]|nr:DegT/DnrJ/EryC1/StrS family aminotransferase [Pseudomonadota bacterium]
MALQVAYKLLDLKGSVLTTPFSFPATTSSIIWHGASPLFADIDPGSLNIDPGRVEAGLQADTSAIVATHVFGNPCDTESLTRIADEHEIPLIFDAAQAFGVRYLGESILTRGRVSILSFHATKLFHSLEGGALVLNDPDLVDRAEKIINFGLDGRGNILSVGINGKMNEFEAAMGLAVLDEMELIEAGLNAVYEEYQSRLSPELVRPVYREGATMNHQYFPVLFPDETTVLRVMDSLHQAEIFPRRYFYPSLDTVAVYGAPDNCPISQDAVSRILCLPVYARLETEVVRRICDIVNAGL